MKKDLHITLSQRTSNLIIDNNYRVHGLTFDKQTIRKNEALNSGVTCLDYDYESILDKYKYD